CGTAGANQRVLAQTHWQNAIKSFFPVTGDSIDIEIKAFCANQAIPPGRSKPIEFWRGQLSANNVPPTNRRARLDQFRPQGRDCWRDDRAPNRKGALAANAPGAPTGPACGGGRFERANTAGRSS